ALLDLPDRRLDGPGDAGGVDQDVDAAAENGSHSRDECADCCPIGDIDGLDQRPRSQRLDLVGQGLQRRRPARGEGQMDPRPRQGEADIGAHPLSSAGHDGDAFAQVSHCYRYRSSMMAWYFSATTRRLTLRVGVSSPPSWVKSPASTANFF